MRLPVSRQSKVALAGTLGALIGLAALALAVWILSRADTGSDGGTAETDTGVVDTGEVETTPAPPPPEERTRTIEVGGFPNAVAIGQGSVWVVRDGRRVLRIDPGSGEVVARLGAGDDLGSERACGIAVGEGAIWVTTISGQVARLNPETNRLARLIAVEDAACVAVGARGVWVTSPNLGVVTRIDPATNEVVAEIDVDGFPEGIVTRFGSVWVANSAPPDGTGGSVLRINPGTEAVGRTIEIPSGPQYLAAGAGSIWASSNDGKLLRIDPGTNELAGNSIAIAESGPTNVTFGRGAVWGVVIEGGPDTVIRFDPASGEVVDPPIPAGEGPRGLAFGFRTLWVTNYDDGSVTAYRP